VERSVGLACARAHLDGFPVEPAPEVATPVPRQWVARLPALAAWDAWDGAHPDAAADEARQHQVQLDADAEKLAAPARDGRAQDAEFQQQKRSIARSAHRVSAAGLYTQDAAQSAARSCEVQESAGPQTEWVWQGAEQPEAWLARLTQ
jgi:hypothetical protein